MCERDEFISQIVNLYAEDKILDSRRSLCRTPIRCGNDIVNETCGKA